MKIILRIFLLVTFIGFALQVYSQTLFTAGLRAGLVISTQNTDDGVSEYSMKPGFQGGAYFKYSLGTMAFQTDVIYAQQGASIEYQGEKFNAAFNYINIPITYLYQVGSAFNIQIGPQIGFLTCAKSDYHPVTHAPYEEQTYTKAYKKTDFGVNIGMGWAPVDKKISIDLRYYLGLTPINDFPGVAETKNIQLTAGYRLFLH